jgi:hypothetical protein
VNATHRVASVGWSAEAARSAYLDAHYAAGDASPMADAHRDQGPPETPADASEVPLSVGRRMAYRHLLYQALVWLRSGSPPDWWNPVTWWRAAVELRQARLLADCFHNLAFFVEHDFVGFREQRFWSDVELLRRDFAPEFVNWWRDAFASHLRE